MPITKGTVLGSCEVISQIGAGGMGEIYRARDLKLKRDVAIKVLPEVLARDADYLSRFTREAELLASLNHPNLAAIYSLGEYEGRPFIVMELLEGQTVKEKIEGQGMPAEQVLDLVIQIAHGLDAAHGKGVVHRDIKPANLFVTLTGQLKILDFGIAKLVVIPGNTAASTSAPTVLDQADLTSEGVTVGTIAYMSPEQVRGDDLDARTDLFSVGLVTYELLTGRQAFSGQTSGLIFDGILNRAPIPLADLNSRTPVELQRIVMKLLEKDRRFRYQGAADLRSDLQRLKSQLESGQVSASIVSRTDKISIAVLPFVDISATREHEYFADGLTDEIITDLSQILKLRVISRNSSMQLKGAGRDLKTISKDLDVQYMLEGTVRTAGTSLRVTAQLIDAIRDEHLWAEKYTGKLEDVFDIQEQISRKIVDALKMKLSPQEEQRLGDRPLGDIRAYECYYRALPEIYAFSAEGLTRAETVIQSGLRAAGDNEVLYAALGHVYWQYVNSAMTSDGTYLEKAEQCARKAIVLNPDSSAGLVLLALVQYLRGNRNEAVAGLKRILAKDPNNFVALQELARIYLFSGKAAEYRLLIERVLEIDPLSLINHAGRYACESFVGHPERYEDDARFLLRTAPGFLAHRCFVVRSLLNQDRTEEARELLDSAPREEVPTVGGRLCAFLRHAVAGKPVDARAAFDEDFKSAAGRVESWAYFLAECYAFIGDLDEAMVFIEKAVDRGFIHYPFLSQHAVILDRLRVLPRYEALLQRVKILWEEFQG